MDKSVQIKQRLITGASVIVFETNFSILQSSQVIELMYCHLWDLAMLTRNAQSSGAPLDRRHQLFQSLIVTDLNLLFLSLLSLFLADSISDLCMGGMEWCVE